MDIEAWVDWARRNLLQRTDYPLIDSTEIDMDRALSEAWASEDSGATLLRSYTVTNPDDIAVRFVILNFLYRLVHWYDADDDDDVVEVEHGFDFEACLAQFQADLAAFVTLSDVAAIHDPKRARWEIVNSCALADWSRAKQLYGRLPAVAHFTDAEARGLLGQFHFRVACAEGKPRKGKSGGLDWWVPTLFDELPLDRLLTLLRCLSTLSEIPDTQRERLRDAAHEMEQALAKAPSMFGSVHRDVLAGCCFVLGEYQRAARHYESLIESSLGFADPLLKEWLYSSTAESLAKAGDTAKAKTMLTNWLNEFPKARGVWLKLAKLQTAPPEADYRAAYESLRHEVENDPNLGEDIRVSIALALGGVAVTARNLDQVLGKYLSSHPELSEPIRSILQLQWPAFVRLGPGSATDWLFGCWSLCWLREPAEFRSNFYKSAAMAFAKAVEAELKGRVFLPFRDTVRKSPEKIALAKAGLSDSKNQLARFVADEGLVLSLGAMLHELSTRLPGISSEFRTWMVGKHPDLVRQSPSFKGLREVRNAAAHPSGPFSKEQAEKAYVLCKRMLDLLLT